MTLDEYLAQLSRWAVAMSRIDDAYYTEICWPWFVQIAPVKAEEYGIECWERLGVKALVADISAMYYRWKSLSDQPAWNKRKARRNALVDAFGYSMIYNVCCGNDPMQVTDDLRTRILTHPALTNEGIIERAWEGNTHGVNTGALVIHQAHNMWKMWQ